MCHGEIRRCGPQIGLPTSDKVIQGLEREEDPRLYSGPPEAEEKRGIAGQRAGPR